MCTQNISVSNCIYIHTCRNDANLENIYTHVYVLVSGKKKILKTAANNSKHCVTIEIFINNL